MRTRVTAHRFQLKEDVHSTLQPPTSQSDGETVDWFLVSSHIERKDCDGERLVPGERFLICMWGEMVRYVPPKPKKEPARTLTSLSVEAKECRALIREFASYSGPLAKSILESNKLALKILEKEIAKRSKRN